MSEAIRLLMCLSPLHSAKRISILDSNMGKRILWIRMATCPAVVGLGLNDWELYQFGRRWNWLERKNQCEDKMTFLWISEFCIIHKGVKSLKDSGDWDSCRTLVYMWDTWVRAWWCLKLKLKTKEIKKLIRFVKVIQLVLVQKWSPSPLVLYLAVIILQC